MSGERMWPTEYFDGAWRFMVHGIEVKPGQVWECSVGGPSRITGFSRTAERTLLRVSEVDKGFV